MATAILTQNPPGKLFAHRGRGFAHFHRNDEMTTSLTHLQNHLFLSSDGAVVDANRLLQEIDREKDQGDVFSAGLLYTAYSSVRKPVQHIAGTILKDTETGQIFDVNYKHRLLLALRAQNKELLHGLQMRELAREFFQHREASSSAFKLNDNAACQKFTRLARDVADRFQILTGLNSNNDAILAMRSMRSLGQLSSTS